MTALASSATPLNEDGAKPLEGRSILLAMDGGVDCLAGAQLCKALVEAGAVVQVALSSAASRFATAQSLRALSGREPWLEDQSAEPDHMAADTHGAKDSASSAWIEAFHADQGSSFDAMVVVPCSAEAARALAGLDDGASMATALARGFVSSLRDALGPRLMLVAPSFDEPGAGALAFDGSYACQDPWQALAGQGVSIALPREGPGGAMPDVDALLEDVEALLQPKTLQGRRVMVTAGPTFEPIDPVRGITNVSSGKMGYAIARAAREAGAEVVLISGPTALRRPLGVERVDVQSASQMLDAVMARIQTQDAFISVAAVADWRVANASDQKLKKNSAGDLPQLIFEQNPDILARVAALAGPRGRPYCVGFAAESEKLFEHAAAKRERKGVPLLVGNLTSDAFGRDQNAIVLFDERGHRALAPADKLSLARALIQEVASRMDAAERSAPSAPLGAEHDESVG